MKNLHIYTLILSFFVYFSFSFYAADAVENGLKGRCVDVTCAKRTKVRSVPCKMIELNFCQKVDGDEVYYAVEVNGTIPKGFNGGKPHLRSKKKCDVFRTCESLIKKATKVIICSQSSGGRAVASYNPYSEILATAKKPLDLTAKYPKKME